MSTSTKVRLVWTPAMGSQQEWTFDALKPQWDVASKTEIATGWPWDTFRDKLAQESAIAYRAILWALRQRAEPRLDLESVEANFDELDFEIIDDTPAPEPEPAKGKKGKAGEDPEA